MSLRSNGSYIGFSRTSTTAQGSASGVWDLRTAEQRRRASAWPPSQFDPDFSSVALLLHMDGSNGSTTFTDSSGTPKTITANGGAAVSTAESKFGGSSVYFNGTTDSLSFADLQLGTGDFCIEMFFKTNSSVQYAQLIGNETANSGYSLLINNDSASGGQVAFYAPGTTLTSSSGDWSDDAWHHVAVTRSGSTMKLYLDGTEYGSLTSSASLNGTTQYIGKNNQFGPRNMVGYIDEVRVTKGVARYTAAFTVPAAAFHDG